MTSPVENISIASVYNTAEVTTMQLDGTCLTSPITDASGIPFIKPISLDYFLWLVNRSSKRIYDENSFIPGFTAVRSSLTNLNFHETTKILTPILPYPATTYDAIFTTMINFQDALKMKGDTYGGLWADEGVYRIAKEIQLLKPDEFSNIFLGLGGFHMEKIVFACLGAYLQPSGIFSVLVETECYGTDRINGVISGSHYFRAHTAHSLIHEDIMSLMLEAFQVEHPEKSVQFEDLLVDHQSEEITTDYWNTKKEQSKTIEEDFQDYLKEKSQQSQSFAYWFTSVFELFPIARDLTSSMRCGDWMLYLSAVELLTHEITSSAFFLIDKDGCVKKGVKLQLGMELLKLCPEMDAKGPETPLPTKAYVVDFMAMVRKIPLKKLEPPVKTSNDFAVALTKMIVNAGYNSDEIHVVFDT